MTTTKYSALALMASVLIAGCGSSKPSWCGPANHVTIVHGMPTRIVNDIRKVRYWYSQMGISKGRNNRAALTHEIAYLKDLQAQIKLNCH
jgi:hypothetical protein